MASNVTKTNTILVMTEIEKKMAGESRSRTVRVFEFLSDSLTLPKSPNSLIFIEIAI